MSIPDHPARNYYLQFSCALKKLLCAVLICAQLIWSSQGLFLGRWTNGLKWRNWTYVSISLPLVLRSNNLIVSLNDYLCANRLIFVLRQINCTANNQLTGNLPEEIQNVFGSASGKACNLRESCLEVLTAQTNVLASTNSCYFSFHCVRSSICGWFCSGTGWCGESWEFYNEWK